MRAGRFALAVASLLLVLACGRAEARGIFILQFEADARCPVTPEQLRQGITQFMPREVLRSRGLEYVDPPAFLDVSRWGASQRKLRQLAKVVERLEALDMRYMLAFSVGCMPGRDGRPTFMLDGRITDLDAIDDILRCPTARSKVVDERRVCIGPDGTFDAVRYARVVFTDYESLAPALQNLVGQLLFVPRLEVANGPGDVLPSQPVELAFLTIRNDGRGEAFRGRPLPGRSYRLEHEIVEIPSDVAETVCAEPAVHWTRLRCAVDGSSTQCRGADIVDFEVRDLFARTLPSTEGATPEAEDRIAFEAPPYAATLVVRSQVRATEEDGEVRSPPAFVCVPVREARELLGVAVGVGIGIDIGGGNDAKLATARLTLPQTVTLSIKWLADTNAGRWLPASWMGAALTLMRMSGQYPCTTDTFFSCTAVGRTPPRPHRLSHSTEISLRLAAHSDIYRAGLWRVASRSVVGIGLESLSSEPDHASDGVHWSWVGGAGIGVGRRSADPGSLMDGWTIDLVGTVRSRLSSASVVEPGYVNSPGVPDGILVLELQYTAFLREVFD